MKMKRLNDVVNVNNKNLKFFKGYMLKDFQPMDFAEDGEIVYPSEAAAISAAISAKYKEEDGNNFIGKEMIENLMKEGSSAVFNVQMLIIKIPTEKFDTENCILMDDDGVYLRIKDFPDRKISFAEYEVTNFAASLTDDNDIYIEQMDFKEASTKEEE